MKKAELDNAIETMYRGAKFLMLINFVPPYLSPITLKHRQMFRLLEAVRRNRDLEDLGLQGLEMSSKGFALLMQLFLDQLPKLTAINLNGILIDGHPIDDHNLAKLSVALRQNGIIQQMFVWGEDLGSMDLNSPAASTRAQVLRDMALTLQKNSKYGPAIPLLALYGASRRDKGVKVSPAHNFVAGDGDFKIGHALVRCLADLRQ